jgi:NTE family protein
MLLNLSEEQFKELGFYEKGADNLNGSLLRKYLEDIYPQLAIQLKLGKNWCYRNLYYAILEYAARKLGLKKYRIYSETEFCHLLKELTEEKYKREEGYDRIIELASLLIKNNYT